jgi:hypothetical protein
MKLNQDELDMLEALKKPKYDFDVTEKVLQAAIKGYKDGFNNGYAKARRELGVEVPEGDTSPTDLLYTTNMKFEF